jgi:hypothetical protein
MDLRRPSRCKLDPHFPKLALGLAMEIRRSDVKADDPGTRFRLLATVPFTSVSHRSPFFSTAPMALVHLIGHRHRLDLSFGHVLLS